MLTKIIAWYCRWLDLLIAVMLGLMVILVFGNVIMRYAFNSGITISEELSRWLFVWCTFLGAVVALKEGRHLGTDMLISRLPPAAKKTGLIFGHLLMLLACGLMFKGSLQQVIINWTTTSAAMEVSMSYFYAIGLVCAALAALILLRDLIQLFSSQTPEHTTNEGESA